MSLTHKESLFLLLELFMDNDGFYDECYRLTGCCTMALMSYLVPNKV